MESQEEAVNEWITVNGYKIDDPDEQICIIERDFDLPGWSLAIREDGSFVLINSVRPMRYFISYDQDGISRDYDPTE